MYMALSRMISAQRLDISIREKLRLKAGNRIDFRIDSGGKLVLTPRNKNFRTLRGLLRSKRSRPASLREMDEGIAAGVSKS